MQPQFRAALLVHLLLTGVPADRHYVQDNVDLEADGAKAMDEIGTDPVNNPSIYTQYMYANGWLQSIADGSKPIVQRFPAKGSQTSGTLLASMVGSCPARPACSLQWVNLALFDEGGSAELVAYWGKEAACTKDLHETKNEGSDCKNDSDKFNTLTSSIQEGSNNFAIDRANKRLTLTLPNHVKVYPYLLYVSDFSMLWGTMDAWVFFQESLPSTTYKKTKIQVDKKGKVTFPGNGEVKDAAAIYPQGEGEVPK